MRLFQKLIQLFALLIVPVLLYQNLKTTVLDGGNGQSAMPYYIAHE